MNLNIGKRILSFIQPFYCQIRSECVKVKRAIKQNNKASVHSKLLRWLDQHSREHNVRSSHSFSDAKLKPKSGQERQRHKKRHRRPLQQLVEPSIFTVEQQKLREGCKKFFIFSSLCAISPSSLIIGAFFIIRRKLLQLHKK